MDDIMSIAQQKAKRFYELRLNGATTAEIANTYHLSIPYVSSSIASHEHKRQLPSSAPKMRKAAERGKAFRDLRLDGATLEDIASMYLCSVQSVSNAIMNYEREYNLPRSSTIDSESRAEEFRNLRLKGVTLEDIASTYGLTRQRVDQMIKRHERRYNLPNSTDLSRELARKAKLADAEEHKTEQRFNKQLQYKRFVPSFQLDAHLVGRFLMELGNNSVLYGFDGKSQSNPKRRKDGSLYPSQTEPTNIFITSGRKHLTLHSWVLQQCAIEIEKNQHCHHIDGDITNNMLENLQVLSNVEHGRITMQEQMEKGTIDFENNPRHLRSLTDEQVEEIRALYRPRVTPVHELAKAYGVSVATMWDALHGRGSYLNVKPATCRVQKKPDAKQIEFDFNS